MPATTFVCLNRCLLDLLLNKVDKRLSLPRSYVNKSEVGVIKPRLKGFSARRFKS